MYVFFFFKDGGIASLYAWKKGRVEELLGDLSAINEKVRKAVDNNEKTILHYANRNFQSLRSKLNRAISLAITTMQNDNIEKEYQKDYLSGLFVCLFVCLFFVYLFVCLVFVLFCFFVCLLLLIFFCLLYLDPFTIHNVDNTLE